MVSIASKSIVLDRYSLVRLLRSRSTPTTLSRLHAEGKAMYGVHEDP